MPRVMVTPCTAARASAPWWRLFGSLLVLVGLAWALVPPARAQDQARPVYIARLHGVIDLGLAPYLARVLDDAERAGAAAVIVELDSPGGRLDAALQMRQALLAAPVRTIAFVNHDAFSAGALIALAANEVYMAPGAVLGAATPLTGDGQTADPKTVSAVRSTFRSTAEMRGRDPRLAEAMVDPAVAVDGLVANGELLTLTTADARAWGYADGVAADRQELLRQAGLADASVRETAPALAEQLVRVITSPVIASLLMTLGLLLVLGDLMGGGGGVAAAVGVGLMGLFFWGHMLAGLAGWEGVALVGLGIGLLALEAFVIPGFGVAGVLGIVAFAGGLFLSLIGGEIVTDADLARAASTVALSLVMLLAGGAGLLWLLVRMGRTGGLVLQARLGMSEPGQRPAAPWEPVERPRMVEPASLQGSRGVAVSDLHPGGFARIGGERVDVVTRGEFLPAGTALEVVRDDGYRRVVRRCDTAQGGAHRPTSPSRAEMGRS